MNKEEMERLALLTPHESIDGLLNYIGIIESDINMENRQYIMNTIAAALKGIKNRMSNEAREDYMTNRITQCELREEREKLNTLVNNIDSFKSGVRLLLNGHTSGVVEGEDE